MTFSVSYPRTFVTSLFLLFLVHLHSSKVFTFVLLRHLDYLHLEYSLQLIFYWKKTPRVARKQRWTVKVTRWEEGLGQVAAHHFVELSGPCVALSAAQEAGVDATPREHPQRWGRDLKLPEDRGCGQGPLGVRLCPWACSGAALHGAVLWVGNPTLLEARSSLQWSCSPLPLSQNFSPWSPRPKASPSLCMDRTLRIPGPRRGLQLWENGVLPFGLTWIQACYHRASPTIYPDRLSRQHAVLQSASRATLVYLRGPSRKSRPGAWMLPLCSPN